jgi:ABC-type transport system involved in multi-copper enzyme maturation permease subunit
MIAQLRSEWMRGRGRPVEKFTGAVVMVLGVVIPAVMLLASSRNAIMRASALETMAFPSSLRAAETMATIIGPFWAAALGANIIGAEFQYGTWPLLLVRISSRVRLALIKIATAAARIVALTGVGVLVFLGVCAVVRVAFGMPIAHLAPDVTSTPTAGQLLIPFVGICGAMAFAAMIAFTITVVSRSAVFGMLAGALAQPFLFAIRFKETASWIPYVHLDNIQTRLLTGRANPVLVRLYEFNWSGRASAAVLALELAVLCAIALIVFRRQEIVY